MITQLLNRRWVQIAIAAIAVVVLVAWLVLENIIPLGWCWNCPLWQAPFWISVFPNFWAEFAVAVVIIGGFTLTARWLASQLQPKPQARVMLEQDEKPESAPRRIWFVIQNTGKLTLRPDDVRWELFIPEPGLAGLEPFENQASRPVGQSVRSDGLTYGHYYGHLTNALFPGVTQRFLYSDLPEGAKVPSKMYFVISTPQGQIPEKLKRTPYGSVEVATAAVVEPYNIIGVGNVTLDPVTSTGTIEQRAPETE